MSIPRSRRPFNLTCRTGSPFIYAKFKDPKTGEIIKTISTKETKWAEAEKIAWGWVNKGIPEKDKTVSLEFAAVLAYIPKLTESEKKILAEKHRKLKTWAAVIEHKEKQAVDFMQYLSEFWDYDNSFYVKQKNAERPDSIHRKYCHDQKFIAGRYWKTFFNGKLLGEINRGMIKEFRRSLNDLLTRRGNPVSASQKNAIMKAGCRPLRYAFVEGLIEVDPSSGLSRFSGKSKRPEILSPEMAGAIFKAPWKDERAKVANLLAATTGMRAGEIQALRIQDIGDDRLYIRHSWNSLDGLKTTKTNQERVVYILPQVTKELLALAKKNPHGISPESFIFWSVEPGKPVENDIFINGLRSALKQCGMSEEESKKYIFHAHRHFYSSYMKQRLSDKLIKSQTGHLTDSMLNHYGGHETAGDEQTIRKAHTEFFRPMVKKLTSA